MNTPPRRKYDVCYPLEFKKPNGEKGTKWVNVGTAIDTFSGNGVTMNLHSMPINFNGRLNLFPRVDGDRPNFGTKPPDTVPEPEGEDVPF